MLIYLKKWAVRLFTLLVRRDNLGDVARHAYHRRRDKGA
ncbi:unnamed protein product [Brassica napus]|uniref:(rape) hypothetical protein n=1 Tax=Brassica napus TaxID=3708 RepID=A0A816TAL9_BRANA|nr:unnamed protein product [Brassica napus]